MVDRRGTPLAVMITAANRHDSMVFEALLDAIPRIKQPRGARRKRPYKVHADKAYDFKKCRSALWRRGIKLRIARRGRDTSERLGRHRWVVERTLAWLSQMRRLRIPYERRADLHEAFVRLGCALLTWNAILRFC